MIPRVLPGQNDLLRRLKWMMLFRALFGSLLLGSTIVLQWQGLESAVTFPLLSLYFLISSIFFLTLIYGITLRFCKTGRIMAFVQLVVDTLLVSCIVIVTGGYDSIFSFLYMVAVIVSAMILSRPESLFMAGLCGVEYGILVALEYLQVMTPIQGGAGLPASRFPVVMVVYKVAVVALACYAVAVLTSVLAEQAKRSKQALMALEGRMQRVEKLAAVGEMAAGLAHEIRNPLASLSGAVQLLQSDLSLESHHEKLMRIVLRETDRLGNLISTFLMFAKPQVGRPVRMPLAEVVSEIVSLFEKDKSCKGRVHVHQDIADGLFVRFDPAHFRQILWNLLLNAAEAIPEKGEIRVSSFMGPKGRIGMKVSDTGQGIPPDVLKDIFDPFFTTKSNGTGLGLSVVHSMLESYDCWLDVDSDPGSGTTFTIWMNREL